MKRTPACLTLILFMASIAHGQEAKKAPPAGSAHRGLITMPRAVAREFTLSAKDFATFRDPQWSALTLAQIGAATADVVTSMNSLNHCAVCSETGPSHIFVGSHPDVHKYVIAGIVEISTEAVAAHYFRRREASRHWYWRMLWNMPQSLSTFEHARAAEHNAGLNP
jgi:hypothetical protein